MRSHGVADVLVDLGPLVQRLHCPALQQVLVPVALLSQHPRQDLLGAGGHLDSRLPQPQREAVVHLGKEPFRDIELLVFYFIFFAAWGLLSMLTIYWLKPLYCHLAQNSEGKQV